jgi:predicted permease
VRLFRRSQRDFEEEVRAHLDLETDQLIAEGHSPDDARHLARKRFGNVGQAQQRYYDSSPVAWLNDAVTDARYALRMMRTRPGFALSVILISSLGLVACVTTFSLVSGILLKPFPFARQDRVFFIDMRGRDVQTADLPITVYDSLAGASEVAAIGASEPDAVTLRRNGELVRVGVNLATPSFFKVYGLSPALGRFFDDDDRKVAVLDYAEWRRAYGSDSGVIGRTVILDGEAIRIIGVMPRGFYDNSGASGSYWMPLPIDRSGSRGVNATLRLVDGIGAEQAAAQLRRYRSMVLDYSSGDSVMASVGLMPIGDLINGPVREPLTILLGAVLLVLALVAANVSTMFLAQVASRAGELGVRRALGAGRGRQLRQLMVESLTLTTVGGAIGLAVSAVTIAYVRTLGLRVLPRIDEVMVDWRVTCFAVGVVLVTGLAGGIAQAVAARETAWTAATTRVASARTSATLVAIQVAVSVVLLVGASLLVKTFLKVAPTNPGFTTANRASLVIAFLGERERKADARPAIARVRESMRAVPGVSDVAVGTWLPLTGNVSIIEVNAPNADANRQGTYRYTVSENYFAVMGMTLRRGRGFTLADQAGSERVAIINETAARRWFGDKDPVGARITMGRTGQTEAVTVIGVVNDTRVSGRDTRPRQQLYQPISQAGLYTPTFIVATTIPPSRVMPALRRAVRVSPESAIEDATDLTEIVWRSTERTRFFSVGMGMFAIAAVVLSALGVYGLLAFAVSQRRREIGIRLALGAGASRIGRSIVGRAATIAAIGAVAGLLGAVALSRYLQSLLIDVTATDTTAFTIAPIVVVLAALVAAALPTLQAIRIDPNESMRA